MIDTTRPPAGSPIDLMNFPEGGLPPKRSATTWQNKAFQAPTDEQPTNTPARTMMYVEYLNGTEVWHPIASGKGWSINQRLRLLCISVPGPYRINIPLDNVASFRIEEIRKNAEPND